MAPALSKEFLDIQANYRVRIHSESSTWHDNNIMTPKLRSAVHYFHKTLYLRVVLVSLLLTRNRFCTTFSTFIWCFYIKLWTCIDNNNNIFNDVLNISKVSSNYSHCVKSVQIRSFFWSSFSLIHIKYGVLQNKSPYISPITGKYRPEKTPNTDTFQVVNMTLSKSVSIG